MSFSDETLMAYADGELGEPARSAVERAMRTDPAVAARVARHKALRANVFAAFSPVLDEPVPPKLKPVAAGGGAAAKVVQLDAVRAGRRPQLEKRRWSWPEWGAIAATLLVGVAAGRLGFTDGQASAQLAAVAGADGALAAQGKLAQALSQQLASAPPGESNLRIGVSFVSKEGGYCRSFTLGGSAGLACSSGAGWSIPVLAAGPAAPAGTGDKESHYRQAGSEMPAAVLDAIDQRISGQALDARAELAARQRGWKR